MEKIFWNDREQRLRAFWRMLIQGELSLLLMLCFGIVLSVVLLLGNFLSAGIPDLSDLESQMMLSPASLLISGVGGFLALLLSTFVAGRFLDRRSFADFGFRFSRGWWLDFGFGLVLGALLMAGIFGVEYALGWVTVKATFATSLQNWPFPVALLIYGLLFLCVGIYEELWFRGYQLRNLAEGLNLSFLGSKNALLSAWLLSSLAFGVAHLGNPGATLFSAFNIALAGIFLGFGYVLTGELALPIGLHIAWNFFQGNVFGFPVSGTLSTTSFLVIEQGGPVLWTGGVFGPEGGILGIVAMVVGSLLTLLWVRYRHGDVKLHTRLSTYAVR